MTAARRDDVQPGMRQWIRRPVEMSAAGIKRTQSEVQASADPRRGRGNKPVGIESHAQCMAQS
jgi:hypothetical protein